MYNPQHTVSTSQSGLYEVVSIQDRYCSFPRVVEAAVEANVIV